MKFAVIVPTYQKRLSLRELLKSLLRQTYKNFIVIIVNNNSGTSDAESFLTNMIGEFSDLEIELLNPGQNLGAGGGRNFAGLSKQAEGCDYFAFIDDDCLASVDWLATAYGHFSKNENSNVIYGTVISDIAPYPPFIHSFDMKGGVFGSGNCVIKNSFFKKVDGFDTYLNNWAEDFEFGERCKLIDKSPTYISELLINHPPKLINYKFSSHLLTTKFYKKYLYLIKVKNYQYKSNFRRDLFLRGVYRIFLFFPLFFLGFIHWSFIFAPFLCHFLLQVRKVPKLLSHIRSYDFKNNLSVAGVALYLFFHWLVDITNALMVLIYTIPFVENSLVCDIRQEINRD